MSREVRKVAGLDPNGKKVNNYVVRDQSLDGFNIP
jgi:hypothetical protein